jgi:hypothetical protein
LFFSPFVFIFVMSVQVLGKEREKFTSVPEMLDVAFKQ